ncbi:MAG TPA: GIY-YIG nuclease family protein [Patescibacteria group bacterium]|nr:GIY-YIG nuclease family protein [Patescibacteria group bacterium]
MSAAPAKPAYVYILDQVTEDGGGVTYVGWTTDVERRLAQHNDGSGARFTRGRQWRLLHVEPHPGQSEAMRREAELKRHRRLRASLIAQARANSGSGDVSG